MFDVTIILIRSIVPNSNRALLCINSLLFIEEYSSLFFIKEYCAATINSSLSFHLIFLLLLIHIIYRMRKRKQYLIRFFYQTQYLHLLATMRAVLRSELYKNKKVKTKMEMIITTRKNGLVTESSVALIHSLINYVILCSKFVVNMQLFGS